MKNLNKNLVAFTGGGTGGHIYPGLAVADELKNLNINSSLKIIWIGSSKGMDKKIVENSLSKDSSPICSKFYGISSGKLRRYFSFKNFTDLFLILGGFFSALHILRKEKPALLFSKGGFVSVPPCVAARMLGIPVFIHECDFTLGLANKINKKFASKIFVSYEETKKSLPAKFQNKTFVSGNPVRLAFYSADAKKGLEFLNIKSEEKSSQKPILLVLGGSLGALQINSLVWDNIDFLCSHFIVVHQTGLVNSDSNISKELQEKYKDSYIPYQFIYSQMSHVIAAADVILSRSGANSIWEAAVLKKPMLLIPLCGNGTRGDQVDNAKYFQQRGAAKVLVGQETNSQNLCRELKEFLSEEKRKKFADNLKALIGEEKRPSQKIADLISEALK